MNKLLYSRKLIRRLALGDKISSSDADPIIFTATINGKKYQFRASALRPSSNPAVAKRIRLRDPGGNPIDMSPELEAKLFEAIADAQNNGIMLPEVTVSTPDWKDMVGRYNIASNDAITMANGRPVNTHLRKAFDEGAKKQAAWAKEHPWLETAGLIASAAPLTVAAYPALAGAGELAYPILTNPYVDAALTSTAAGHGLNHWLNEGINGWGDAAMTALELTPLGRVAKPIYERVVQPGMRLFNSPLTGNWTTIGNRQYRLNPNSLSANGSLLESRSITSQITAENASSEMSNIVRTVGDNGKIRLSLPSHTNDRPRQFVLEPQGNNKFYVHMRTWDGDHIPANLTNEEKQQLFDALYNELPEGAEILFPKSGPGYYGTRGTVAGLQRLARDPRFTPGTRGTLQYLDKDGKTIRIYEGTSFIKIPQITAENAVSMTPEQWTAAQDAAMTALELTPLGKLARPIWNAGKGGLLHATKAAIGTNYSIGQKGLPYYYDPVTKKWDFSTASQDVKRGIDDLKNWMNDPTYRAAAEANRAEAETMGLSYVPYYERPEYAKAFENPNIKYRNLNSSGKGGEANALGEITINTGTKLNPSQVVRHELGHVAGLGNVSNASASDLTQVSKELKYLRYKSNQVFKEGSDYAGRVDLNKNAFEGIQNARDFGEELGIKIGQEYPGYEKALEIVNSYPDSGFKAGLKNMFRLDREHMPYVWKALAGTLFALASILYNTNQ